MENENGESDDNGNPYEDNKDDNDVLSVAAPHVSGVCEQWNMPLSTLQHVSSGIWSDVSYEHHRDDDYFDEAAASMENNEPFDSDYDDVDFDEESGSIGEEEEEEDQGEFCEEDEDDDDSASQVLDFVEDLQVKFQTLVSSTIVAAEEFLDHPSTLHLAVLNSSEKANQKSDREIEKANEPLRTDSNEIVAKCSSSGCCFKCSQAKVCHDVEIQTDDNDILRSSGTLIPNSETAMSLKAEQLEIEISELEAVKESFVAELENWRRLLDTADVERDKERLKTAARTICQIHESIEAVDKAIEVKSGIAAEAQGASSQRHQDMEFAQLVTNLESVSTQDLQRLLGVYFKKAVELGYSSHELEKDLNKATSKHEDLSRRYTRKKEQMAELEQQHQTRILEFVCKNADPSYYSRFRRKEEQLTAARKKHNDLEKSLTALLVRHGYLLDGVDYDVKQVVRTLGIEDSQLATVETKGRITRRGGISAEVATGEVSDTSRKDEDSSSPAQSSSKSMQKRQSSSAATHQQQRASEYEVKREKRRLTIQPTTNSSGVPASAASSSRGARDSKTAHRNNNPR